MSRSAYLQQPLLSLFCSRQPCPTLTFSSPLAAMAAVISTVSVEGRNYHLTLRRRSRGKVSDQNIFEHEVRPEYKLAQDMSSVPTFYQHYYLNFDMRLPYQDIKAGIVSMFRMVMPDIRSLNIKIGEDSLEELYVKWETKTGMGGKFWWSVAGLQVKWISVFQDGPLQHQNPSKRTADMDPF